MTEFKVFQQTSVIDDLMSHLKNGVMGMAMARDWDYERKGNFVYFKLKPRHEMKLDVIFWLGYFTSD